MGNGKMLEELRKLAESEKSIPVEAALRLILASQADSQEAILSSQQTIHNMDDLLDNVTRDMADIKQSRANRDESYGRDYTITQERLDELNTKVSTNTSSLEEIKSQLKILNKQIANNWVLKAGIFLQAHPKAAIGIVIILAILANLWFISGFRQGVLHWLGVPVQIIDLLNPTAVLPAPIGTPTPTHIHFWELTPGVPTPFIQP